jgi:hypothetical protein
MDHRMRLELGESLAQAVTIHDVTLEPAALLGRIERWLGIEIHDLPSVCIQRFD